ncbi:hypothetical protein SSPNP10_11845 [Streptomyces sp. NP10]|uniref:hypothetical protein n=1 Tax=Streptomyces sp. NP10 TaxID=1141731 RepID=UPI000F865C82|nr:hypothetical protein [Streptomyces sp. NP10]RUP68117.1 hypothetical protein SSPNP10_11845 [Streptomyces sp. NP10]
MSSQSGETASHWQQNPFPVSAVARFSPLTGDAFSIQTPAVADALAYVDSYLQRSEDRPTRKRHLSRGNVIAVVGEYGTGKTHLSIEIFRRIRSLDDSTVHSFYLDAPAGDFVALYRQRFFGQLDRKDIRRRVAEYYADIVAEELGDSPLTVDVALLLLERQASPHEIVQRFGLRESTFQQRLQEHLKSITEHEEFGVALALFLRPEFEAAVWEWLEGHPPDTVLQERGIRRTIDDDISALEAIGVFAFLYGRQHHRFVLIVDEFEKVLSRESRSAADAGTVLAFKKLLEIFGQSHSLLVLCGLPDFLEVLPDDAKQRVASVVRPTALSFEDACKYVHNALGRSDSLKPFTDDSLAYLVELSGGNARKVIRLCYHAYEASARSGADITRAMVREVARQQFEVTTPDDVRADIARILDSNGWAFEQSKSITGGDNLTADYWIPVGTEGAGCIIQITQSILNDKEAERLTSAVQRVQLDGNKISTLLVINGYLAEPLVEQIGSVYSRVLTYSLMRFTEDFSAAVGSFINRLEQSLDDDRLGLVEAKLDQLLRQTRSVRRTVDLVHRDSISAEYLESSVEGGIRRAFGNIASGGDSVSNRNLSPRAAQLFRVAFAEAESLTAVAKAELRTYFVRRHRKSRDGFSIAFRRMMAVSSIIHLIETFRDSVTERHGDSAGPQLMDACRSYDAAFDLICNLAGAESTSSARWINIEVDRGDDTLLVRLMSGALRSLAEEVWREREEQRSLDLD